MGEKNDATSRDYVAQQQLAVWWVMPGTVQIPETRSTKSNRAILTAPTLQHNSR